ncbi:MAG: carboxypeptidase M32 [Candidatus Bipolaricaulaceae bacterium]
MSALADLRAYVRPIRLWESAAALGHWDQQTNLPPRGVEARAAVVGQLERAAFDRVISRQLADLLQAAERELAGASQVERAMVAHWRREHRRKRAVPPELYQQWVEACSRAHPAWREARATAEFGRFRPYLEKIVDLTRRLADHLGFEESPYDALLEESEPGMTAGKLRQIMAPLRADLVPFLRRLGDAGRPPAPLPAGPYPADAQRELARRALTAIGYDFSAGRLDDSAHPFTVGLGPGDVRITNRYCPDSPLPGLFGALHEGGHALYGQGLDPDLAWTGLDSGASAGMHEAQARLWENQVGRSPAFWQAFHGQLEELFPHLRGLGPQRMWQAACRVRPSPIRVEADEVTYNLHICVRFELEVELIEGRTQVGDLPRRWREAMEEYLGVVPANDAEGVLQDVHWSGGMFGYFPSYLLGNLYAAQIAARARQDLPHLDQDLSCGDAGPLRSWLTDQVYRWGRTVGPEELLQKITGEGPSPRPFLTYLKDKYSRSHRL